jgi:hypothetical protein
LKLTPEIAENPPFSAQNLGMELEITPVIPRFESMDMSSLTCINATAQVAHFVLSQGNQVVARLPGISPGAQLRVAVGDAFSVTAQATVGERTYVSAPLLVTDATTCSALWQAVSTPEARDLALVLRPQRAS